MKFHHEESVSNAVTVQTLTRSSPMPKFSEPWLASKRNYTSSTFIQILNLTESDTYVPSSAPLMSEDPQFPSSKLKLADAVLSWALFPSLLHYIHEQNLNDIPLTGTTCA
jgi:hypothetical protein